MLKGQLVAGTIGALNPPKFGSTLAGRWIQMEGEWMILAVCTAIYDGPTDQPPHMRGPLDQRQPVEFVKAVDKDYMSVLDVDVTSVEP